uniref:Uncharacterized protein n=1 Tax=Nelumbo nucifera TaxID=4432 RepID=A0A822Y4H4_NELNU|nr:TPA_asm: hypothetical protein HUJ06_027604 [Nelumbo nucifera]
MGQWRSLARSECKAMAEHFIETHMHGIKWPMFCSWSLLLVYIFPTPTQVPITVQEEIKVQLRIIVFLVNWLERFPEYKTRDFYVVGERYVGQCVPQLANAILQNKNEGMNNINLRGIMVRVSHFLFLLG